MRENRTDGERLREMEGVRVKLIKTERVSEKV